MSKNKSSEGIFEGYDKWLIKKDLVRFLIATLTPKFFESLVSELSQKRRIL